MKSSKIHRDSLKNSGINNNAIGKLTIFILIIEYYFSVVLIPGTSLLSDGMMGFVYFITLCYLFLGIAIVADIFME